jgi:NAD(P)-dependent dehydrogenase (short-subunit alcohol dehydrogenase family)
VEPQGKTILITGSTDGVGRVVAKKLASPDIQLLIHGRDRDRGEQLAAEIKDGGGGATFYQADLSSLDQVRALAERIGDEHPHLQVLINNAGVGTGPSDGGRKTSRDGFELCLAVNYLAPFLLTRLLLPLLTASAPARVVNVASIGQAPIDFDNIMLTHGYSGRRAYGQSKLALIMFTFDLAHELEGTAVTANCLHPATYMDTHMVHEAQIEPQSTPEEGAEAILHLAMSSDVEGKTGRFFDRMRESRPNDEALDQDALARLRKLSIELTGLAPQGEPRRARTETAHAL